MLKFIYAVAAAAIVAGAFVATLSVSAQLEARGSVPGVKVDQADKHPLARDSRKTLAVFRGVGTPAIPSARHGMSASFRPTG